MLSLDLTYLEICLLLSLVSIVLPQIISLHVVEIPSKVVLSKSLNFSVVLNPEL